MFQKLESRVEEFVKDQNGNHVIQVEEQHQNDYEIQEDGDTCDTG